MTGAGAEHDRRSFLRRAGLAALAAPTLPWVACVPEPSGAPERNARGGAAGELRAGPAERGPEITRPILVSQGADSVVLVAPPAEVPAAYVSMAERRLFVDLEYRDQVYWDLHAHISVSTGVWRLPLVGDPPEHPVMPGDAVREFEELTMRDWDPTAEPAENDIRIMVGRTLARRVDLECAPVAGGLSWLSAGPWDVLSSASPGDALIREDFHAVGSGMRYADRECTLQLGPARVITWAVRDAVATEGV
jgi:hypothetical protein